MTYTIQRAQWANEDKAAAIVFTAEAAAVAISEVDTPEEWAAFLKWAQSNVVADLAVAPECSSAAAKLARLGLTIAELKALLAEK